MNNIKFTEGSQPSVSSSTTNIFGILRIFLTMFKKLYTLSIIIIWVGQYVIILYKKMKNDIKRSYITHIKMRLIK